MRVLLDACVPHQLGRLLTGHDVRSATDLGLGDFDDRPLLDAIDGRFDALVTVDRRLPKQQVLAGRTFSVVVLRAKTNRLVDLQPLVERLLQALRALAPGEAREIGD
ncbi:MAG TPA: DUF5615 family PIN-like protein [Thermoanaerobaculia bacterium]|nr:DUF5615 family PIN-like protein [Thermoanaerobaculia bacterium]